MFIERMLVALSIATLVLAVSYAGSAAISTSTTSRAVAAAPVLDASHLAKRLTALDTRLRGAQASIDEVLVKLANTRDDSERDAARVRLDVLFRLENGLTADIARTRDQLARIAAR